MGGQSKGRPQWRPMEKGRRAAAFFAVLDRYLGDVMPSCRFDVLGIGNAIVDVISLAGDDFLAAQGLRKGAMTLIDEARAEALYKAMGPATFVSGGSAANTIIGA